MTISLLGAQLELHAGEWTCAVVIFDGKGNCRRYINGKLQEG